MSAGRQRRPPRNHRPDPLADTHCVERSARSESRMPRIRSRPHRSFFASGESDAPLPPPTSASGWQEPPSSFSRGWIGFIPTQWGRVPSRP